MYEFQTPLNADAIEKLKAAHDALLENARVGPVSFAKMLEGETCDEMIQSTIKWVRANTTGSYDKETKTITLSCPPFSAETGIR